MRIALLGALLCCAFSTFSQDLLTTEDRGTRSEAAMKAIYGPFILYGVERQKMTYTTIGSDGQPDTASGLFIVPDVHDQIYPVLVYHHGTVDGPADVPSALEGGYQLAEVLAGMGYVVAAPDYLGLGDSRGFHPYVDPVTESRATLDMVSALKEYVDTDDEVFINNQLFLTGYSQGGHASMAAQRTIEQNPDSDLTVTAGAHMSGPYSISEKMVEFTLGDTEYFFVAYLPNTLLSLWEVNPDVLDSLEQVFLPQFVPPIEEYYAGNIGLNNLNAQLIAQLTTEFGASKPRFMLQDSVVDALFNQPDHFLTQALASYDVADWTPMVPTRMFYCEGDDQVTYLNAIYADSLMNANGAPDAQAVSVNMTADHGGCVEPATLNTVLFFGSYQSIEQVVGVSTSPELEAVRVYPQPAATELLLSNVPSGAEVNIYHTGGRLMASRTGRSDTERFDISQFPVGAYLIELQHAGYRQTKLIVVQR